METVGVIGAGQMGAGIAQVAAQSGYRVLLSDRDIALAEKGKGGIAKRLGSAVEKGKATATDAEAALGRIETVGDYAAFGDAVIVIEAATEREEIKRAIFATQTTRPASSSIACCCRCSTRRSSHSARALRTCATSIRR
jgi:3-hydroxybutyryl-CoA dehydrogenase